MKILLIAAPRPNSDGTAMHMGDGRPPMGLAYISAYVEDFGHETKIIDLDGKTMIPGLVEGHGHIMGVGYNQLNLDLLNTNSFEEIIEKTTYLTSRYNFNIKDYFISEFNKGYPEKINILHIKLRHKNLNDTLEISQKKTTQSTKNNQLV